MSPSPERPGCPPPPREPREPRELELDALDRAATAGPDAPAPGTAGPVASLLEVREALEACWSRPAPDELWGRVLRRVEAADPRPWRRWGGDPGSAPAAQAPGDLGFVREDERRWEPAGYPGIEVARLALDEERQRVTMLVRMAAGSAYPPHRHVADEECFVLSGELRIGPERMQAGDFQRAPAGSTHPWQSTSVGCTLLIVSSLEDELLDSSGQE